MKLETIWKQYEGETEFNLSVLPESIQNRGRLVRFAPKSMIVTRGEKLEYLYFIQSGQAIGKRDYVDGKEYKYFRIDSNTGNVGLLELMARYDSFVATIMSLTEVTAVRIDAVVVYEYIMSDIRVLRRCSTLIARDLYSSSGHGGIFYYLSGLDRVRYQLAEYYNQNNTNQKEVTVDLQYRDIASYTGLSVRTVSRSLQRLRDTGEIRSVRQKIIIGPREYEKLMDQLCEVDFA